VDSVLINGSLKTPWQMNADYPLFYFKQYSFIFTFHHSLYTEKNFSQQSFVGKKPAYRQPDFIGGAQNP